MSFYKKFIIALAICVACMSCNKNPYSGYTETQDGLFYKIYRGDSKKDLPQLGDVLTIDLAYYLAHNDSVIFDSKVFNDPVILPVINPLFKGDINEGMFMIAEGDSASFIVKADSFLIYNVGLNEMPDYIGEKTMLRFEIKVLNHKTQAEYMQEEKLRRDMYEAEYAKLEIKEKDDFEQYIKTHNIHVKPSESGLYFIPIRESSGAKIEVGDLVLAHYKGYFLDEQIFDSSEGREPFSFSVGYGQVIPAWDEAVLKMKKGGKAKIITPSKLAYGKSDPNIPIPPFSTLIFEIEIVDVQKRDKK